MSPRAPGAKQADRKRGRRGRSGTPSALTPAMRQYLEQKAEVGDAVLLFRMGDFYETFYEDAKTVSRVLGLTLTSRSKNSAEPIPLAGVPYHAVDGYIAKLVRAGYKVAISEQVEDPKLAKGIVKRAVDRVITPGTLTDAALLDERSANYLAALCPTGGGVWDVGEIGLACVELASGRFFAQVLAASAVVDELARLRPAEVLVPEGELGIADCGLGIGDCEGQQSEGEDRSGGQGPGSGDQGSWIRDRGSGIRDQATGTVFPSPDPRTPIVNRRPAIGAREALQALGAAVSTRPGHVFDPHMAERALCEHFGVSSLAGFGFDRFDVSLCAAAAVLDYLKETQKSALAHILRIVPRRSERWVLIDQATLRSLEVERVLESPLNLAPTSGGCGPPGKMSGPRGERGQEARRTERTGSLLDAIDMTAGPMGARRLREWLCYPLRDGREIQDRQDAISTLREQAEGLRRLRELLREMGDVERILARLGVGRASPRDMVALGRSLGRCGELPISDCGLAIADWGSRVPDCGSGIADGVGGKSEDEGRAAELDGSGPAHESSIRNPQSLLFRLEETTRGHDALAAFLGRALKEDAPPVVRDGGFIADGYDAELDRLRRIGQEGHRWLAEFQAREAKRSGVPTLKVGYNSVFGYYIEVTHQHRDKVPADYVRKQTVRNAERYITDELKRHESEVLGAADRAKQLESELFEEIRQRAAASLPQLRATSEAIATLDVLAGLAELSRRRDYCRPEVVDCGLGIGDCGLVDRKDETQEPEGERERAEDRNRQSSTVDRQSSGVLEIVDGRHPVLDVMLGERFVPNDCRLSHDGDRLLLITGPNMAGKSTYIRQVALLVLLAQTGSYVPARSMRWRPVDRIFARVGASDELARGRSTFMVEMVETARILHNATPQSLVVLDEIGRGTSTYDGLALAWAITEYVAQQAGCHTLFATHYHEVTELAEHLDGVANFNVAVREALRPEGMGRDVVFLHKIVPGATDRSYGVHVAAMAGLPKSVVKRSEVILSKLESRLAGKGGPSIDGAGLAIDDRRSARNRRSHRDAGQLSLFSEAEPMPDWWHRLVDALEAVDIDRTTPLDALSALRRIQGIMREGGV